MKVVEVEALIEYRIHVEFEDVRGVIDLSDLVQQGKFKKLREEKLFSGVYHRSLSCLVRRTGD